MKPSLWDSIAALFLSEDTRMPVYIVLVVAFALGVIAGHFG